MPQYLQMSFAQSVILKGQFTQIMKTLLNIFFVFSILKEKFSVHFHFMENSSLMILISSQKLSYIFEMTRGLVNDARIFILGWTVPLSVTVRLISQNGSFILSNTFCSALHIFSPVFVGVSHF